jgi:hypothetical protein
MPSFFMKLINECGGDWNGSRNYFSRWNALVLASLPGVEMTGMEDMYLWAFFTVGMLAAVQWLPMPGSGDS